MEIMQARAAAFLHLSIEQVSESFDSLHIVRMMLSHVWKKSLLESGWDMRERFLVK